MHETFYSKEALKDGKGEEEDTGVPRYDSPHGGVKDPISAVLHCRNRRSIYLPLQADGV